jgi:hypothetical protein
MQHILPASDNFARRRPSRYSTLLNRFNGSNVAVTLQELAGPRKLKICPQVKGKGGFSRETVLVRANSPPVPRNVPGYGIV